jgi:S-adenosylmethionine hydrolase
MALLLHAIPAWTAPPEPNGLVILATDYGTDSIYVGLLKGAVYARAPKVRIDDLTNGIPNFDILAGAYIIAEGCVTYPEGTVFCCVVDPGVGTARRPIALTTKNGWYFVAPDNGLLTLVAERYGVAEVRECTNKTLWRVSDTSTTFHGRDIFGPVAGALAAGTPFEQVGDKRDDIERIDLPVSRVENGLASGQIIRADTYGNLVTNVRREDFEKLGIKKGEGVDITVGEARYSAPYVGTYGDVPPGDRLVVIQSAGFVELAANMNSLADILGEGLHAPVTLRKAEPASP